MNFLYNRYCVYGDGYFRKNVIRNIMMIDKMSYHNFSYQ